MATPVHRKSADRQAGVTLLLTILLLAALSTIVFSLAAVSLNEVRTSSDVTISEPVITADEAVNEDVMFAVVWGKGSVSATCATPSAFSFPNGNNGTVLVNGCTASYLNNPYTLSGLAANAAQSYVLYNPADISGTNCPNNGTNCPGYTSIRITQNTGTSSNIYLCLWATVGCNPNTDFAPSALSAGASWPTAGPQVLDPNQRYQLVILNGATVADFSIATTTNDGTNHGLPSGTTVSNVTGTSEGITRRLQSTVP